MSINKDLSAKGAIQGWATHKCHGQVSKHAATHSPAPITHTTDPAQCDSCGRSLMVFPWLMKSDPMYCKAIDILEKQDKILAERRNKHICSNVALMTHSGDLGDNQLVFPIAALLNQFQLQLKYKSVQDALKLLSAEHIQDGTLASYQLHKHCLNAELELHVHHLEAMVIAYKFCDKQLILVQAEIGCILCPDMLGHNIPSSSSHSCRSHSVLIFPNVPEMIVKEDTVFQMPDTTPTASPQIASVTNPPLPSLPSTSTLMSLPFSASLDNQTLACTPSPVPQTTAPQTPIPQRNAMPVPSPRPAPSPKTLISDDSSSDIFSSSLIGMNISLPMSSADQPAQVQSHRG
ncbi:hypothetical protein EDD85DRAFT_947697 [Armillaria nabsnona]|nr:hypothetical protein EDD85DRAFT_947697 [Armillaria nabsnona]